MHESASLLKMSGMKKLLLAAIGAAGLLAGCSDVGGIDSGYYGTDNSSTNLNSLTNYTTNNQLSTDVRDQNGRSIGAGTYVICDNRTSSINFNLNWSGYLRTVGFQFKGYNTGNYTNTGEYNVNSGTGTAPVSFNLGSGMAPLNIKSQSIVVVPVTKVTVLGYTYVRAQGTDATGHYTNTIQTDYSIPVVNCYDS